MASAGPAVVGKLVSKCLCFSEYIVHNYHVQGMAADKSYWLLQIPPQTLWLIFLLVLNYRKWTYNLHTHFYTKFSVKILKWKTLKLSVGRLKILNAFFSYTKTKIYSIFSNTKTNRRLILTGISQGVDFDRNFTEDLF